jgi:hypothetical protein
MWYAGDRFESVFATHSRQFNAGHGTMESTATATFTLAGEVFAQVSMDVLRPDRAPSHGDDWARIVGAEGVIEVRPNELRLINSQNDGSTPLPVNCDRTLLTDFLNHLDGTARALIDAPSTLRLTEACLLARQSADEHRVIEFPRV